MGPIWFFEGFAIYAVGQFEDVVPASERIWEVVNTTTRGSYRDYGAVIRYFLKCVDIHELVARAGVPDFVEWLRGIAQ